MMNRTLLVVVLLLALTCSLGVAQTSKVQKLQVGSTASTAGAVNLAPGTAATAGINFGDATANLYRSAAGTLKTDGALTVTGTLTMGTFAWTNASATGTWDVTGATTLNGACTLGDAVADVITVNGAPTFKEAVIAEKTLAVTGNTTLSGTLAVTGAQTNTGALTVNGNTTLGNAATDTITCVGAFIPRTLVGNPLDATPADRPAGVVGEIAVYTGRLYLCTDATVDAEVWVIIGPPA